MEIVRFSTVPHLAHDGPLSASWLGEERTLLRRILTTFGPGLLTSFVSLHDTVI